jgi:hypothetical protein
LEETAEQIWVLNCFVHGQALWIDELQEQVSGLRGEPVPPSVLLSPSLGSASETADDKIEVEEEAEVRVLVEAPHFQEVGGPAFTTPLEENEEPLPIAGTSTVPRPGVGYLPNSEHRAWILEVIQTHQEANRRECEVRGSDASRLRLAVEAFEDPAEDFDPRVDS